LWTATTDERIDAILPMIPCLGQLFGGEGLEAITVPTLIIAGTQDPQCIIDIEGDFMYEYVGSADKFMVSIDMPGHGQVLQEDIIRHYATAFFGYYLQGIDDYAEYLVPESAELFEGVTVEVQIAE
jgi:predicted dienelactone hydrolase